MFWRKEIQIPLLPPDQQRREAVGIQMASEELVYQCLKRAIPGDSGLLICRRVLPLALLLSQGLEDALPSAFRQATWDYCFLDGEG